MGRARNIHAEELVRPASAVRFIRPRRCQQGVRLPRHVGRQVCTKPRCFVSAGCLELLATHCCLPLSYLISTPLVGELRLFFSVRHSVGPSRGDEKNILWCKFWRREFVNCSEDKPEKTSARVGGSHPSDFLGGLLAWERNAGCAPTQRLTTRPFRSLPPVGGVC